MHHIYKPARQRFTQAHALELVREVESKFSDAKGGWRLRFEECRLSHVTQGLRCWPRSYDPMFFSQDSLGQAVVVIRRLHQHMLACMELEMFIKHLSEDAQELELTDFTLLDAEAFSRDIKQITQLAQALSEEGDALAVEYIQATTLRPYWGCFGFDDDGAPIMDDEEDTYRGSMFKHVNDVISGESARRNTPRKCAQDGLNTEEPWTRYFADLKPVEQDWIAPWQDTHERLPMTMHERLNQAWRDVQNNEGLTQWRALFAFHHIEQIAGALHRHHINAISPNDGLCEATGALNGLLYHRALLEALTGIDDYLRTQLGRPAYTWFEQDTRETLYVSVLDPSIISELCESIASKAADCVYLHRDKVAHAFMQIIVSDNTTMCPQHDEPTGTGLDASLRLVNLFCSQHFHKGSSLLHESAWGEYLEQFRVPRPTSWLHVYTPEIH